MKKLRYAPGRFPSPLYITWLAYLTMDIYKAPGWLWGSSSILFLIFWALFIHFRCNDEQVDIKDLPLFKERKEDDAK